MVQPDRLDETSELSFLELATLVINDVKRDMTFEEIWEHAQTTGLTVRLHTRGKTPAASLGALLYTSVKRPDSPFLKIGARPARFYLKSLTPSLPPPTPDVSPKPKTYNQGFHERSLHPLLVRFASDIFDAHCKTIRHERSIKKSERQNQWLHPDLAGFSLTTGDWPPEVVQLAQATGASSARFYSFEMKISLEFSTLREYFFQAVSNSSWAHEGYLVAAKIDEDA